MNWIFWCLAWIFYWIGHVASIGMGLPSMGWIYPFYNWVMTLSSDCQDKCNYTHYCYRNGPWIK